MSFGLKGLLKLLAFLLLTTYYILHTTPVRAAEPNPCAAPGGGIDIGKCFGFGHITSLGQATSLLITPIFSLVATAVVFYFLWGAFKYLISKGEKEGVAEARQILIHSIIGFMILMFAFLILQFLLSSLFGITDFQIFQS